MGYRIAGLIGLIFAYCLWWMDAPSSLVQQPDDDLIGKSIYIPAGSGAFLAFNEFVWGGKSNDLVFFNRLELGQEKLTRGGVFVLSEKYLYAHHGASKSFNGNGFFLYQIVSKTPSEENFTRSKRMFLLAAVITTCRSNASFPHRTDVCLKL